MILTDVNGIVADDYYTHVSEPMVIEAQGLCVDNLLIYRLYYKNTFVEREKNRCDLYFHPPR